MASGSMSSGSRAQPADLCTAGSVTPSPICKVHLHHCMRLQPASARSSQPAKPAQASYCQVISTPLSFPPKLPILHSPSGAPRPLPADRCASSQCHPPSPSSQVACPNPHASPAPPSLPTLQSSTLISLTDHQSSSLIILPALRLFDIDPLIHPFVAYIHPFVVAMRNTL